MSPARLLVVLLIVFVVLSGLNLFYYYERTKTLDAQAREVVQGRDTRPLAAMVKSRYFVKQSTREFDHMVIHEGVLVVWLSLEQSCWRGERSHAAALTVATPDTRFQFRDGNYGAPYGLLRR